MFETSGADLMPVRRVLAMAADDLAVADDYLANLLAPSGPDARARQLAATSWRSRLWPWTERGTHRGGVPQGDQMHRSRIAANLAVDSVRAVLACTVPEGADVLWRRLVNDVRWGELGEAVHGLRRDGGMITPDAVQRALNALRAADTAIRRARVGLGMLEARSDGHS